MAEAKQGRNVPPLLLQPPTPTGVKVMLKKIAKDHALPTLDLNFTSLGEKNTFGVTYFARDQQSFNAVLNGGDESKPEERMKELVLFIVQSWEADYALSGPGIEQAEGERPGFIAAIIQGWYMARNGVLEKN